MFMFSVCGEIAAPNSVSKESKAKLPSRAVWSLKRSVRDMKMRVENEPRRKNIKIRMEFESTLKLQTE